MKIDRLVQGADVNGGDSTAIGLRQGSRVSPELLLDPLRARGSFGEASAIETRVVEIETSIDILPQTAQRVFAISLGECTGAKIGGAYRNGLFNEQ